MAKSRQTSSDENFQLVSVFGGYISKPEITNVKPNYLVKGSKNVFVDYANRVVSRNGYTLYRGASVISNQLITDGNFLSDPSLSGWNFGPGWSWDNINNRMVFTS